MIEVPTSLLVNTTFRIQATANGLATGVSGLVDVRVICGSETVAPINSTAHELVLDLNLVSFIPILPQWSPAAYWVSDKAECGVTHYQLYSEYPTTISTGHVVLLNGKDPSTAQI